MTKLSMYCTEIDFNNANVFLSSFNPEKLISTVNETLTVTLSGRVIACPSTWSGGRPRVLMASETAIWPLVLPSRSPWVTANDFETCALRRSPLIDCESRAPTSPWSGSSNETCVPSNETGTCGTVSGTWICGRWSGTCGCVREICCPQTSFLQTWSGSGGPVFCCGSGT